MSRCLHISLRPDNPGKKQSFQESRMKDFASIKVKLVQTSGRKNIQNTHLYVFN